MAKEGKGAEFVIRAGAGAGSVTIVGGRGDHSTNSEVIIER